MQQAQSSGAKAPNENLILKTCEKKVKEDVRLIHENLYEMLKLLKMEDDKILKVGTSPDTAQLFSAFFQY